MGIEGIAAVAVLATAGAVIIKTLGSRGAPVMTAAVITLMLSAALGAAEPIFDYFGTLPDALAPYAESAIKAVGIGYTSGIVADICRERGEGGIAKAVTSLSKIEIVLVALPHLYEISELAIGLVGGTGA